jgi:WD40 repeat protein
MLRLSGPVKRFTSVAFSPDSRYLAAGCPTPRLVIWDLRDPKKPAVEISSRPHIAHHLAFVGPTRLVAASRSGTFAVVNLQSGHLWTGQPGGYGHASYVTFATDGKRGFVTGPGGLREVLIGDEIRRGWEVAFKFGSQEQLFGSVAMAPSGDRLLVHRGGQFHKAPWLEFRSPRDGAVGSRLAQIQQGWLRQLAWFPDGRWVVGLLDKHLEVWDTASGAVVVNPQPKSGRRDFLTLAVHPKGRLFAAGSVSGAVHLWRAPDWSAVASYAWEIGKVRAVAFAPDGAVAAAVGDGGAVVWDLDF